MKENWIKNIIILSGGFDPVHKGHIRMFREAANLGSQVIVGLNSDEWLTRKKGNVPELDVCKNLNVTMLWGIGGGKIQSSSWLINGGKDEVQE